MGGIEVGAFSSHCVCACACACVHVCVCVCVCARQECGVGACSVYARVYCVCTRVSAHVGDGREARHVRAKRVLYVHVM